MTVREITAVGDPILRRAAPEMSIEELRAPETQDLIDDLIETRRAAAGAGLAATQIGVPGRVAVVEVDEHTRYAYKPLVPLTVIVNPVVEPDWRPTRSSCSSASPWLRWTRRPGGVIRTSLPFR